MGRAGFNSKRVFTAFSEIVTERPLMSALHRSYEEAQIRRRDTGLGAASWVDCILGFPPKGRSIAVMSRRAVEIHAPSDRNRRDIVSAPTSNGARGRIQLSIAACRIAKRGILCYLSLRKDTRGQQTQAPLAPFVYPYFTQELVCRSHPKERPRIGKALPGGSRARKVAYDHPVFYLRDLRGRSVARRDMDR
jgi:hypothetical protein